jgi:hypothetical protein
LPDNRWVAKENIRDNPKVPRRRRLLKNSSGEMEDHTKTMNITTKGLEFEMPSHYMKEVVASVKTKGQS